MSFIYSSPNALANGAIINRFCHIYQNTKPTARPDGSALVFGDIWYKSDEGMHWTWNGILWVNNVEYQIKFSGITQSNLTATTDDSPYGDRSILFTSLFLITFYQYGILDTNNRGLYSLTMNNFNGGALVIADGLLDTELLKPVPTSLGTWSANKINLNTFVSGPFFVSSSGGAIIQSGISIRLTEKSVTGNPSFMWSGSLKYRFAL